MNLKQKMYSKLAACVVAMMVAASISAPIAYADSEEIRMELSLSFLANAMDYINLMRDLVSDAMAMDTWDYAINQEFDLLVAAGLVPVEGDTFSSQVSRHGDTWYFTYSALFNLGTQQWELIRSSVGVRA